MAGRNEAVGKARYETEVDPSGLAKGLKDGEDQMRASGVRAEAEATKQASSAASKLASIGKAGMVALSGVAVGMTVALVGRFQELDRATAEFRRETGATAEEARRAGQAINDMAGRNLQPIEEIGDTLTKVNTDLGLTGDEAERTTEKFLRFAQATGQDAAGAVLAFDDVLDSWGLTAEDAAGIMDQLVASHERFGGSIESNQEALSTLAPALRAMNLTVDDGIGLLNLFAASGIDAAAAQRGLNGAVTRLPKGENLRDFLDRVSSIEDPTKRAAEAVKVFGTQAGVKLANALGPGKGALADYIIAAEDVPGATEKAADASLTLVDRLKLGFGGFISDTVALLGPAGPLLTAVGSLAPLLIPAFAGVWKAVIGSTLVTEAIALAGAKAGAIFVGTAEGVGFLGGLLGALKGVGLASLIAGALARVPLAVPMPDAAGYDNPKVQRAFLEKATLGELQGMLEFAKRTGDRIGQEVIQGYIDRLVGDRDLAVPATEGLWTAPIAGAKEGGSDLARATWEGFTAEWMRRGREDRSSLPAFLKANRQMIHDHWDELGRDAQIALEQIGLGLDRSLAAQQDIWTRVMPPPPPETVDAATRHARGAALAIWVQGIIAGLDEGAEQEPLGDHLEQHIRKGSAAAVAGAEAMSGGLKGLFDRTKAEIRRSMKEMRWEIANPGEWTKTVRLVEDTIDGLNRKIEKAQGSGNKRQVALLEGQKRHIVGIWQETTGQAYVEGERITKRHGKGIEDGAKGKDGPKAKASKVNKDVRDKLDDKGKVAEGGSSLGTTWMQGILDGIASLWGSFTTVLGEVAKNLGGSLPETGPLVGSWHGGGDLVDAWFAGATTAARRNAGQLQAALMPARATLIGAGAGWSLDTSGTQTVNHQVSGRVEVALSGDTMAAARSQGASWDDVARMAAAAGALISDARQMAGLRFTTPRRV